MKLCPCLCWLLQNDREIIRTKKSKYKLKRNNQCQGSVVYFFAFMQINNATLNGIHLKSAYI